MSSKYFSNITEKNQTLKFTLSDIPIAMANAIRRVAMAEIPVIAIDYNNINMIANTSILNSEFLKDRIKLIPINNSTTVKNNYENYLIKLNIINESLEMKDVFVDDFEIFLDESKINNKELFSEPKILLARLKPNNQIIFEFKLTKNISKKGGPQFNPTSCSIYTFERDEDKIKKEFKKCKTDDEKIEFNTLMADRLYKKNKDDEPHAYNFMIESVGYIDSKEIIKESFNVLENKLNFLKSELNANESKKIKEKDSDNLMDAKDFIIIDEDDTLGNLIAYYLYKNKKKVEYAGYLIPHPLDNKLIIRLKTKGDEKAEFIKEINNIVDIINNMKKEWK